MNDFSKLKELVRYLPESEDRLTAELRNSINNEVRVLKNKYPHGRWNTIYYLLGGYDYGTDLLKKRALTDLVDVVNELEEVLVG